MPEFNVQVRWVPAFQKKLRLPNFRCKTPPFADFGYFIFHEVYVFKENPVTTPSRGLKSIKLHPETFELYHELKLELHENYKLQFAGFEMKIHLRFVLA